MIFPKIILNKIFLKKNNDNILWILLPDKTKSDCNCKQYLEIFPAFENDSLKAINLITPKYNKDYDYYNLLISKYNKPKFDRKCQFLHQVLWDFKNTIIIYTETDTIKRGQQILYSDLNYAKKNTIEFKKFKENLKQIENHKKEKVKDSIAKREKIINNAF